MKIVIPGKPVAKARPKFFTKKTKTGKTFTGAYSTQKDEEGYFIQELKKQIDGHQFGQRSGKTGQLGVMGIEDNAAVDVHYQRGPFG